MSDYPSNALKVKNYSGTTASRQPGLAEVGMTFAIIFSESCRNQKEGAAQTFFGCRNKPASRYMNCMTVGKPSLLTGGLNGIIKILA